MDGRPGDRSRRARLGPPQHPPGGLPRLIRGHDPFPFGRKTYGILTIDAVSTVKVNSAWACKDVEPGTFSPTVPASTPTALGPQRVRPAATQVGRARALLSDRGLTPQAIDV